MSNEDQKNLENFEQNEVGEQNIEPVTEPNIDESSDLIKDEDTFKQDEVNAENTEELTNNSKLETNQSEQNQIESAKTSEVVEKAEESNKSEEKTDGTEHKGNELGSTETPEVESKKDEMKGESNSKQEKEKEVKIEKTARQRYFDKIFEELQQKMKNDEIFEVEVKSRIRGGLRVHYKDIPLFLPTSHLSVKRNPSEEELNEVIGKTIKVQVHEYQEFDEGRKAVIVSRRKLALKEVWDSIKVGDVIEGRVSSVPSFGVFVEFNGVEGLIHISRLSHAHVKDPKDLFKKGDKIKAKIIEIDKENNKIALSRKEIEESLWKGIEEVLPPGTRVKGKVKRLTDFGAYVEIKPGVEGLLRNSELSWTRRYKRPFEILQEGQEIEVEIISISENDEKAQLSYKRVLPNPWQEIKKNYPIGSEYKAEVMQVIPQGAIIHINDELDGFMPRSKMKPVMKGKKIPYKSGDKLTVVISDINPAEESLILEPKLDEEEIIKPDIESNRKFQNTNKKKQNKPHNPSQGGFSIGDFLSDSDVNKLKNMND